MATLHVGTNANNSLTPGITFQYGYNSGMSAADIASVCEAIKNDATGGHKPFVQGGYFSAGGQLFVPRRGMLQMFPGDVVAVDITGWPILISKNAIANGPWHTA